MLHVCEHFVSMYICRISPWCPKKSKDCAECHGHGLVSHGIGDGNWTQITELASRAHSALNHWASESILTAKTWTYLPALPYGCVLNLQFNCHSHTYPAQDILLQFSHMSILISQRPLAEKVLFEAPKLGSDSVSWKNTCTELQASTPPNDILGRPALLSAHTFPSMNNTS